MKSVKRFSAVWCGPCRAYGPIFEKVSKNPEFKDITFESVDVDDNEELAAKYKVTRIPTTVFVNDAGEEVNRLLGLISEEDLTAAIRKEQLCES